MLCPSRARSLYVSSSDGVEGPDESDPGSGGRGEMRQGRRTIAATVLVILVLANWAWADSAPDWLARGARVEPGETPTYVQMVWEEVLLTVEAIEPGENSRRKSVDYASLAHLSCSSGHALYIKPSNRRRTTAENT